VLKNTNFMLLFLGRLVSRLGDSIFQIGISWYVLELTGSAVLMGSLIAVSFLTIIVLGPFAGNVVDQFPKVKLMVWMDYIRGGIVSATALVILLSDNRVFTVIVLYVMAVITSICTVIFNPATSAIVPLIISKEELLKANSWMSITGSLTSMIGILFGGILYGFFGAFGVLLLDGVSYILSGFSEMFITTDESRENIIHREEKSNTIKAQILLYKEGISYLKGRKGLLYIGIFALFMNFSLSPAFQIYQPYLIQEILNKKIIVLTVLSIITTAGMFVGGLLMSLITSQKSQKNIVSMLVQSSFALVVLLSLLCSLIFGVMQWKLSYNQFILFYGVVAFFIGVFLTVINIPIETYIQQNTEAKMMGRVNSVVNTLSYLSIPLGYVVCGILVETVSIEYAYLFNVSVLLIVSSMLLWKRNMINLK